MTASSRESLRPSSSAQFGAWRDRHLPPVEEIRAGLWSIPVPIPDHPLRYIISYAFVGGGRAVVVDPGWPTEESWQALCAGLSQAGVRAEDVDGVLLTHAHHDHRGLAGRLRVVSGAWVGMHHEEAIRVVEDPTEEQESLMRREEWMRAAGAPDDAVSEVADPAHGLPTMTEHTRAGRSIADREVIALPGDRNAIALWTPGHSPGHLCFYLPEERLLLTGDHVLPRISPNISAFADHPTSALTDFLRSLEMVSELDVDEVLPAHEFRFGDLGRRVGELLDHHSARLTEVLATSDEAEEQSGWDVARQLPWSRPWEEIKGFHKRAALGEALSHLHHLESVGKMASYNVRGVRSWRRKTAGDRAP